MEGLECEGPHNEARRKEGGTRGGGLDVNCLTLRCDVAVNMYVVVKLTLKRSRHGEPKHFH
jgi:hypothetical protein